ncbi:outer membrane beta-barrel family protein [Fluviicola chungangensis]|uniref:TonB-dependent receptor n=1 Tax=Fluviicola chungangensis TaxID=2597671 RepID=A0A556N6V1_9FLAO|nr:outer membrane beta-barrel family protein [Fluviicola chungangensis]TSJ47850.1 TonB-dependent receptor [Fluviicola chungangensis]
MTDTRFNRAILFFSFFILQLFQNIFAQQVTVSGKIAGADPMSPPIVRLCNFKDSTLVKAAISDSLGNFEIELSKTGTFLIIIDQIDYQKFVSPGFEIDSSSSRIELPEISLHSPVTNLDDVVITVKKPFIERKIDRVIVNPDALVGSTGTTVLELLEKAPGITVDFNGNISLKGKSGVQVFIDNKPTYMSQEDLAGYLRSLPSNSVASIEIMTNPPARYDASGNAGIINIVLKKLKEKGFNGGITLSYGQGRYLRSNNSFNFNYRVNKINLFSTLGWSQNNSYQDLDINRYYFTPDNQPTSSFLQNSYIKREHGGRSAKIGMDWYMSQKSTFGVVFSGFYNPSYTTHDNTARILAADNSVSALVSAYSTSSNLWYNGSANMNYTLKIDSLGKELSVNADYIRYASDHEQTLDNKVKSTDGTQISALNLSSSLPVDMDIKTAKIDYINPLKKNNRLEFGIKTAWVSTDNTADFYDVVNNTKTPNYTFSNRFLYKEKNHAAYANYAQEWGKFGMQLGLRFESIQMQGHQLGNPMVSDSSFTRMYNSLFPTAYFSYTPDSLKKHQFNLSFGRRIDYPNYQDMNPFTYPMDAYTYYAGNPYLKPTFSYNFDITYSYKNIVSVTVDYSLVHNLINETNEQVNNIYYSRPGNYGNQTAYGISASGEFNLTAWWNVQYYSECKNIGYNTTIYNQPLVESRWYWYIGPAFRFTITPKFSADLAGSYQTRILSGQFLTIPVGSIRVGFAYKILKEQGSVKLNLSDVFHTTQPGGDIRNIANSKANWLSKLDTRVLTISFSYRFSKGKALNARQSGASDSEKQRVNAN